MWSRSAGGGSVPWWRQTTMGTLQISQSAIQQTSSSWYQVVRRAASQSSQPGPAVGTRLSHVDGDGRARGHRGPRFGSAVEDVALERSVGRGEQTIGLEGSQRLVDGVADDRRDDDGLGSLGDRDGDGGPLQGGAGRSPGDDLPV